MCNFNFFLKHKLNVSFHLSLPCITETAIEEGVGFSSGQCTTNIYLGSEGRGFFFLKKKNQNCFCLILEYRRLAWRKNAVLKKKVSRIS